MRAVNVPVPVEDPDGQGTHFWISGLNRRLHQFAFLFAIGNHMKQHVKCPMRIALLGFSESSMRLSVQTAPLAEKSRLHVAPCHIVTDVVQSML
jgi:hypothetical protein